MSTTGNFKQLRFHDAEMAQVMDMDNAEFPRPWKKGEWESLNWNHHILFGWFEGVELVAFALFGYVPGDDVVHLLKICLKTTHRGSGVAHTFWTSCLSNLKASGINSVYLEVEATNLRAIGFYQKQGFLLLRKIKSYYSDGTDAQTMQLTL